MCYRPLATIATEAVSQLRKLYLSYNLPFFWEMAREITSSFIQSALAFLCLRMRAAEESSGPFTYIASHRNAFTQIVDCWAGSGACE